jgi:hypothetical protein
MLPFLKKKSEQAAGPTVPPWHPNFRNYEKLPDIKVVRTAFFINGSAVALVLVLLTYFGIKEWQLHVLNGQIAEWQRQIDKDKKESDQAVAMFNKFKVEEAKINEVDAFVKAKAPVSELVIRLARTLPANIALDSLDLRETGLMLRLSVRGAPDTALGYASAYLEQLRGDAAFSHFEEFQFASPPTRNPTTGRMAVEFFLRLKGAKK